MKFVNVNALDEMGKILIPAKLGVNINLTAADRLTATVNLTEKTVTFSKQQDGEFALDEYNRVTIPRKLCTDLEWGAHDKLTVTLDTSDQTILLSMHEKHIPQCVFCQKPEIVLVIHGFGICGPHVSQIVNSGHK